MKLCLLDADYIEESGKSVIRLFCKDKNGKTIVALDYDFEPYLLLNYQYLQYRKIYKYQYLQYRYGIR